MVRRCPLSLLVSSLDKPSSLSLFPNSKASQAFDHLCGPFLDLVNSLKLIIISALMPVVNFSEFTGDRAMCLSVPRAV